MNKKLITPLLAIGILTSSGAGLVAMASETGTTTQTQTQTQTSDTQTAPDKGLGGPGGGHRGGFMGFEFGKTDSTLTIDQQKQLNLLRAEYLNTQLDYREEQQTLATAFKTALDAGQKEGILTAWDALSELNTKMKAAGASVLEKIQAITGTTDENDRTRQSFMTDKIEALRNAASDAEIKAAIEALQPKARDNGVRPLGRPGMKQNGQSGSSTTPDTSSDSSNSSDGTTSATTNG